jgi:Sec-independent protein translocase protein TatA
VGDVLGAIFVLALVAAVVFAAYRGGRLLVGTVRETRARTDEDKAHLRELRAAEKAHKRSVKAYEGSVRRAEKHHSTVSKPPRLGGVGILKGSVTLYEDRVETSKGNRKLTPQMLAAVDTAGNLAIGGRSTLTRMGAGAVLAGPIGFMIGVGAKKDKKVDTRELYLTLQDDSWGVAVPMAPDKGPQVRQLALDIVNAARRAPEAARARAAAVKQARDDLERIRSDRSTVTETEMALAALSRPTPLRELEPGPGSD